MNHTAYIGLGSNLEDRLQYLKDAIFLLDDCKDIKVIDTSSIYETDPVGYENQANFLNMVVKITTNLSSHALLEACMEIERTLGRKRDIRWGPRTIDLDILLYNHENIETERLIIPHPRMSARAFVLIPLLEVSGNIMLPSMEKPLELWLNDLPDKEGVRLWKRKNGGDVFALFES